jgi:hypothetical protein
LVRDARSDSDKGVSLSLSRFLAIGAAIFGIAAGAEFAMGRKLWGVSGQPGLWSGDIHSSHNSQYFADPYSFTHITHGALFYGLFYLIARRLSLRSRAVMTLTAEAAWEVFENTDFVINRYRAATISLDYFGDSVVNSMSDILFCMIGFWLVSRLPARTSIVAVVLTESILALTIRDSLLLNIIMLIHPVPAILHWQLRK